MRLIPVISYFSRLRQDPFRNNRMRYTNYYYTAFLYAQIFILSFFIRFIFGKLINIIILS
ncbi:hypothetical protein BpHYR1_022124 [Brachionus plicatilis]|uniref:Uncharacterized protein n=1 Tax=Brachionus plicatilis TaxID=10195 RepID=A0A3M7SES6_BRAPC|nr:hypothetical protein BpHYR1_022124 [Brachionus plicatilis]